MAPQGRTPAERLLDEATRVPFRGWDFSVLGDRIAVEPPPWDFEALVDACAGASTSMLDMGTGGGEWLSARRRAACTVATETWSPNVPLAADRLRPLGIAVVHDEGAVDNTVQSVGNCRGRLAFRAGAFDLVVNRHEAFVAREVRRVLVPGGLFVTQQSDSGTRAFHELLGMSVPPVDEFTLALAVEQLEHAGLRVEHAIWGHARVVFADIGALAWYLANVPWAVPGFTVDRHREALVGLHGRPIHVASARFVVRARA